MLLKLNKLGDYFFSFNGRIGRRRFLIMALGWPFLIIFMYALVQIFMEQVFGYDLGLTDDSPNHNPMKKAILSALVLFVWMSAITRRLHDLGKSGKPALVAHFIMFCMIFVIWWIGLLGVLIFFVMVQNIWFWSLAVRQGEPLENHYGKPQ